MVRIGLGCCCLLHGPAPGSSHRSTTPACSSSGRDRSQRPPRTTPRLPTRRPSIRGCTAGIHGRSPGLWPGVLLRCTPRGSARCRSVGSARRAVWWCRGRSAHQAGARPPTAVSAAQLTGNACPLASARVAWQRSRAARGRGSEQRVVGAGDRRSATGCKVTAVPGEAALEVRGAHHEAVGGDGLAIGRGIESSEMRIESDEREDEGLDGRVEDGERGELWVLLERARPWEPVGVRRGHGVGVAARGGSSACWAAALVWRLRREIVGPGGQALIGAMCPSGHGHRSLRAPTTCWTETVAWPAAAA